MVESWTALLPPFHPSGNFMRQVVLYPGDDGFWVIECPSLPGCVSQGETKAAAIENIREAIQTYSVVFEDDRLRAAPTDEVHVSLNGHHD